MSSTSTANWPARGDLATRKDAFNEKKSHNLTGLIKPGEKALIAVRVYDWAAPAASSDR